MKFQAIKGVRDILPPESALWNRVEQTARDIFETYNFGEIRLPIFEQAELFARSIGLETDVVSKEMYTFEDHEDPHLFRVREFILSTESMHDLRTPSDQVIFLREFCRRARDAFKAGTIPRTPENERWLSLFQEQSDHVESALQKNDHAQLLQLVTFMRDIARSLELGEVLTLRPETTASVCRAYIEHGMHTLPGDVKLYYIGPMFRRERPQKGRYRQFYQIGAEVLGPRDHPAIDAEVIEMLMAFLGRLKLAGAKLYINSIGCKECRPAYVACLRTELEKVKAQLGADSQRRMETNPLRVLDSKLPEEQPIIEKLPRITEHLCANCREHFAQLKEQLALRGVAYEENWRLVRGLDYYMRTTFEITAPGLGAQDAICGGGRYDGLVELLGGPPTKGIGFAIGTDRVILALQHAGAADAGPRLDVFIAWLGTVAYPVAAKIARRLRAENFSVELPPEEVRLKKSLGLADKLGARYALIIGEDEVASGSFVLKRLSDAEQKKLSEDELIALLRSEVKRISAARA